MWDVGERCREMERDGERKRENEWKGWTTVIHTIVWQKIHDLMYQGKYGAVIG